MGSLQCPAKHNTVEPAALSAVDRVEFIARDTLERAVRFVAALVDHVEAILHDNPRSGRCVPEIGNAGIRELIYRGYRIVYRLKDGRIEILTVF